MLLCRIGGLLQNWVVLCAPEKKEQLLEFLNKNQGCGEDCALGPLYSTGRHLKFSGDEAIRDLKWVVAQPEKMEVGEMSSSGPWWWSFDAALEMVKW